MPYILRATGKYGFGMSAVAAQFARQSNHPFHVAANTVFFAFVFAFVFDSAQSLSRQILNQDCVLFVRLIAWSGRLKIKTDRIGIRILKLSQLSDFFPRNTHGSSP